MTTYAPVNDHEGPPSAEQDQDLLGIGFKDHEHRVNIGSTVPLDDDISFDLSPEFVGSSSSAASSSSLPTGSSADSSAASVWTINYYQRFFDINTNQLAFRLLRTLFPFRGPFYTETDHKPDLYGPFWICTSLIVLMAATGNIASFFSAKADDAFDFTKVTVAASCLYSVVSLVPLVVWFFLDRLGTQKGLVEVMSLYGYSLFPFLPTCILCIAPIELLRWISVLTSFCLSASFLLRNLVPRDLPPGDRTAAYVLLGFMFIVHAGVALLMKFYFFSYSSF